MEIKDKVVVVTGSGGGGCGRAIACRFGREGASVVVSDINEAGGEETVRQIRGAGGRAEFLRTDMQSEEQVRALIAFAEKTFGGLHVLVNNASGPEFRPDVPLEFWAATIQTDLLGSMFATRFAIDAMRRSGGGAIVSMSSTSALSHGRNSGSPSYDVAKAGIFRLTTALGWLAEKDKIRVNCLVPGWIAAPHVREYWEGLTPEQRRERGAPTRLLQLEEVAGAILRLATDESLYGRILVWWSEDEPRLIATGDAGYAQFQTFVF
ncbi:MAG TPA: SDR family oxidoreductase [Candidatus Angelobacter sp.]|nr:SDR family oxidoreductase [Candidatus Angelobacter sp.]